MERVKRHSYRAITLAAMLAAAAALTACGGSSTSSSTTATSQVNKVVVNPTSATIPLNSQQTFAATVTDSSGNGITSLPIVWAVTPQNVATINSNGVATAVNTGTAQVTATVTDTSVSPAKVVASSPSTLTITQVVASVTIQPATATIAVGGTQAYTATALDAKGNPVNGVVFSWSSSFANVATVDKDGLATGQAKGTVTIVASAQGVFSPPATLTVN